MEVTDRMFALLDTAAMIAADHYDRTPIDRIVSSSVEMALTCCNGPADGNFDNVSNAIESLEKDLAELRAYLKEDTETRRWRLAVAIDDYLWLAANTADDYYQDGCETRDEMLRHLYDTMEDVMYGEFWKEYVPTTAAGDDADVIVAYDKMVKLINEWMGE